MPILRPGYVVYVFREEAAPCITVETEFVQWLDLSLALFECTSLKTRRKGFYADKDVQLNRKTEGHKEQSATAILMEK
jgi:hypothetical protein